MVAAVAVVAGYANRDRIRLKIASVYASVPPKAAQPAQRSVRTAGAFTGDAPWALSALPECFMQLSKATSRELAYVQARLPQGVTMIRPPRTLRFADCVLQVRGDQVFVRRGTDRMRIPPAVRVYLNAWQTRLALLRAASSGYELRVYQTLGKR
ncbi:MAG TPA: hypothetical protein VFE17_09575 [Candidatus Baltobacteraceae bacterium]|nr:hypothetical protein [Candidatus Baltobacteraceae bacterium]